MAGRREDRWLGLQMAGRLTSPKSGVFLRCRLGDLDHAGTPTKRKGPRPTDVEKEVERHDRGDGGLRGGSGGRHDGRVCEQQAQRIARQLGSEESTLPLTLRGGKRMSTFGFELPQPNNAKNWQHG